MSEFRPKRAVAQIRPTSKRVTAPPAHHPPDRQYVTERSGTHPGVRRPGMMAFQFRDLMTRWHNRRRPQACPSTPDCPGQPTNSLARFTLANERLRCGECGKAALALYWRREAALRSGAFLREPADAAHQQALGRVGGRRRPV